MLTIGPVASTPGSPARWRSWKTATTAPNADRRHQILGGRGGRAAAGNDGKHRGVAAGLTVGAATTTTSGNAAMAD
jgi:hypothetical protein